MCFRTVWGETTRIVAISLVVFPSDPAENLGFAPGQRRTPGKLSAARNRGCVHLDERWPTELQERTVSLAEVPSAAFEIDHARSPDRRGQPDAQAVVDT
jgi:hypothetical protein